jgi:hypothetical protein
VRPWAVAAWLVLNAAPEPLTLPGFRLHLQLSEDIEPDRLEALARPGVVLWLETASNALKRSVAERLGRAEASYVQVRPPFGNGVRQQYSGHIHPWVALEGLDVSAYRRWAPGGSAVEWAGALTEERLGSLQALRPQTIHWQPGAPPTPDEWARAARLTGLEVHPQDLLPPCARLLKGAARIRLRVKAPEAEASAAGCGFALRLEVPLAISEAELRALLVRYPGAELWARLAGEADAATATALVGLLVSAVPPARGAPSSGPH